MEHKDPGEVSADIKSRGVDRHGSAMDSTLVLVRPDGQSVTADVSSNPSTLLTIPLEIRQEIYSQILSNRAILIQFAKWPPRQHQHGPVGHRQEALRRIEHEIIDGITFPDSRKVQLSLLVVCSQIHAEAHLLLYSNNTFTISHESCLLHFLHPRTPRQLEALRYIRLDCRRRDNHYSDIGETMRTAARYSVALRELVLDLRLTVDEAYSQELRAGLLQGVAAWKGKCMIEIHVTVEIEDIEERIIGVFVDFSDMALEMCKHLVGNGPVELTYNDEGRRCRVVGTVAS